jgi:ribonuclease R
MMQARYSAENVGHFGLASKSYTHFTSPIRRYPDLVAHRVLEKFLPAEKGRGKKKEAGSISEEFATEMAQYLSDRERKVVEAERNITALFSCWYMKDKIGEEDEGIIVSCIEFGVFVRLSKFHVDGLLHVASLGPGYFHFDPELLRLVAEGSRHSYGIGDKIQVVVAGVNIERRHIDLHLAPTKKEARRRGK